MARELDEAPIEYPAVDMSSERAAALDTYVSYRPTADTWRGLVRAAVDLALVVDPGGTIRDVSVGESISDVDGWPRLIGKAWPSVVGPDSRAKAHALMTAPGAGRSREVNVELEGVGQFPFRFNSVRLDGSQGILMVGRDYRPVSALQQQMVAVQQSAEREYGRLRQGDTRYRLFFHVCAEAVLVCELEGLRVLESNPSAASLFEAPPQDLLRVSAAQLLDEESGKALEAMVAAVSAGGKPAELQVKLRDRSNQPNQVTMSVSLFRQAGTPLVLLRLWETSQRTVTQSASSRRLQALIETMPDSFVVVGEDHRILSANPAFCEMVSQAGERQVEGEHLERWLGRAPVDVKLMFANLKEHGSIKNFATLVRNEVGAPHEAMVTAVAVLDGKVPCYGFAIRLTHARLFLAPSTLPRSVEQLKELVGRVPLKDIVRESADLIERLCIQAALDVSQDNRASAAQLLGLSRQGLYSKLRRYGMGSDEVS
jgi:transcriptional regulator PpsR